MSTNRRAQGMEDRSDIFPVAKVKERLLANLETHRAEYAEAMDGYKKAAAAKLKEAGALIREMMKRVEAGEVFQLQSPSVALTIPTSHEESYLAMLDNLELRSDKDNIELSTPEVDCYLRNKWDWSHSFESTKAFYGVGSNR